MFFRCVRPLTVRATSLATTSVRSNTVFGPLCARTQATTPDATTFEPESATIQTPTESKPRPQLPYFVARNTLNNLGVYQRTQRGGNLKYTIVKKVEGDPQALRNDLQRALVLSDDDIYINNVTSHIWIKGHKYDEVKAFLLTIGF